MSAACQELGVSRSLYYQLRKRFVDDGPDGLHPTRRRGRPPQLDAAAERQVIALALSWPSWGPQQLSDRLAMRGIRVARQSGRGARRLRRLIGPQPRRRSRMSRVMRSTIKSWAGRSEMKRWSRSSRVARAHSFRNPSIASRMGSE